MSGLINDPSVTTIEESKTAEQKVDDFIEWWKLHNEDSIKCATIRASKSDFLELYGNGLIKNQQVKGGSYTGIYKGVKIEAEAAKYERVDCNVCDGDGFYLGENSRAKRPCKPCNGNGYTLEAIK